MFWHQQLHALPAPHVAWAKPMIGQSVESHQIHVHVSISWIHSSIHTNISTLWILVSTSQTGLWAGRLNVNSCPMSSNSNTGAQASMSSCYSMAAAYNLGDCPDANDAVRWAACGTSGGCSHTIIFTQQWCRRLKIDDSRSVHERRLVKKSILAATSLVLRHHDRCIVLLYIQPCGMIPHDYKYPIWLVLQNAQFWRRNTDTYAPEFMVCYYVEGLSLELDPIFI